MRSLTARLHSAERFVAYTDGLVEQDRDLDRGIQLLTERVLAALGGTAREISDAVASAIPTNAHDDIAYTVIRRTPTQGRLSDNR